MDSPAWVRECQGCGLTLTQIVEDLDGRAIPATQPTNRVDPCIVCGGTWGPWSPTDIPLQESENDNG